MILNTFQLPKMIADLLTSKKPYSIGLGDRQLKDHLINILTSGLYNDEDKYAIDKEPKNIYLHSIEESINSTNKYSVSAISRFVGVEPNIHYPMDLIHLVPSPIIRIPCVNGTGSRVIFMANAFLRAHFSLDTLKSFDKIQELVTIAGEMSSDTDKVYYEEIFENAAPFLVVSRNLSTLYRDLMVENHEDGLFDIFSTEVTDHHPALEKTSVWFYKANMTYVVTALAVSTMKILYNNIAGMDDDLRHVERVSMEVALDSMIALALIDNTFKCKTDRHFIIEFMEDHAVVKKLVEVLTDPTVTNKDYLTIMTDITRCIASVERSIS